MIIISVHWNQPINTDKNFNTKKNKILWVSGLILFLFSIAVMIVCSCLEHFADIYSFYVASKIRFFISYITGWFYFSLFELMIPIFVVLIIGVFYFLLMKKLKVRTVLSVFVFCVGVLVFLFVNTFGVCYFCSPVDELMGFKRENISRELLYHTSGYIEKKLENSLDNVSFAKDGASINNHNWDNTNRLIDNGYEALRRKYTFISDSKSHAKKIALSFPMTYTHISGIFIPFTCEANVNTNYPDYVVAFSIAHEKAHQRGIASEDEANFIAFLALINSDDEYLEYCAYMNMYEYFLDSMFKYDKEMYYYLLDNSDERVLGEMRSYYSFFEKYRGSVASKLADGVNDTYIKMMGDSDGVDSYGMVVELVSAYIKKETLP